MSGNIARRRDHGDGGIDARGPDRWRLRWRVGGERFAKSFRGSIGEARKELRRLIKSADDGAHVAPDKITIADYLRGWLDSDPDLAPKTKERYLQLAEQQIVPHLGTVALQALRPAQVASWHSLLLKRGGARGGPLAARTVGHAHRLLHRGLERAASLEMIVRNVAHGIHPPKVEADEVVILSQDQIAAVLAALQGKELHPIVSLALGTGMRRGELCALAWGYVHLEKATVRVERSMEQTKAGLRFKVPKTRSGRRTISLAASTVEMLRAHRRRQMETRLQLGMGKLEDDDLVFVRADGLPYPPDTLSRDWWRTGIGVEFHAMRHTHASALIAAGLDVVSVSKRLGHSSPNVTLGIYAHLFHTSDTRAADAIQEMMP